MDELFRDNPVFNREVQNALGLRGPAKTKKASRFLGLFFVGAIYLGSFCILCWFYDDMFISSASGKTSAQQDAGAILYSTLLFIGMLINIFGPNSLTAGAITTEREKQTWNAVLLSRLTNTQIVIGKLAGGLASFYKGWLVFLPLMTLLAIFGKMPFFTFLISQLFLTLSAVFSAILGLFVSWRCKNTKSSSAVASGAILGLTVGTGVISMVLGGVLSISIHDDVTPYMIPSITLNPFYGLICFLTPWWVSIGSASSVVPANLHPMVGLISVAFCGFLGTQMMRSMLKGITRGHRDMTG
jgi:hypothetical protein